MLADQVAQKINENIERTISETQNKLTMIQTAQEEVKNSINDFATHITIVERKVAKVENDFNERLLQELLENATITLTEKYAQLQKNYDAIQAYNNQLAKSVDELTQEKLNQSMFVAGLNAQQREKSGFIEFAREVLKIDASENDFKAIFQVRTKGEPLLKSLSETWKPGINTWRPEVNL